MSSYNHIHNKYMNLALDLAEKSRGFTAPNPNVGCIIVKNGSIIGQGYHKQAGDKHAELNAIDDAIKSNQINQIDGSIMYVTLEPCCHYGKTPPCTKALIKHNIKKVIIATLDPSPLVFGKGLLELQQAGIEVELLSESDQQIAARAQSVNQGFISRIEKNRPFIRSKIAVSLDGAVALKTGESKWITNAMARQDVHKYRAYSDAIVTTAKTVVADNPRLDARLSLEDLNIVNGEYTALKQPIRVVLDKYLDTSPEANIYNIDDQCIIITSIENQHCHNKIEKLAKFKNLGIKLYYLPLIMNYFDLAQLWSILAELGCNDVLIEAGGRFNGYLLENQLVDEWLIYQAGIVMGPDAMPMFNNKRLGNNVSVQKDSNDSMAGLFKLKCKHIERLEDNWRLTLSS